MSVRLPAVRLLHTSDLHIADGQDPAEPLRIVVDAASAGDIDLVLIAGDLFDHARVRDETVGAAIDELSRLDRPVVVVPGNHDCVGERSIYHRADLTTAGPHVYFAGRPEGEELLFDDLRVRVWARGIENHRPAHRPLEGFRPAPPDWWSVVLTHGHYVARGEESERSSRIGQEEIEQLDCHYLALGHWHHFQDVSEGAVTASYSGSPSRTEAGEPTMNLVTLDPSEGARIARIPARPEV